MTKLIAATLLALFATAAAAQVTSIESANPAPKKSSDPNRIICEKVSRTGSRLEFEKVCMTALEWQQHRDGHRADVEDLQRIKGQSLSR